MEIQGIITNILPERTGVSARGEWKSQEFVITTQEQYPRMVCFQVFGADKIAMFALKMGEVVTVSFDISAREYQGRYYNQINAWKVERPVAQQPAAPATAAPQGGVPPVAPPQPAGYVPPANGGYAAPPATGYAAPPQGGEQKQEGGLPF